MTQDNVFGEYLRMLRKRAGKRSLDQVVDLYRQLAASAGLPSISKSVLSLYERGRIDTPRPETLRILAEIYGVPYAELANEWFQSRFALAPPSRAGQLVGGAGAYRLATDSGEGGVSLITVERHLQNQAALPKGSQVAVAAVDLVDNTGGFFKLIAGNLRRDIRYTYLLAEDQRSAFESFVEQLKASSRTLKEKLRNPDLLRFVGRSTLSLPVSYVLYLLPDGKLQGYISLPEDQYPRFYLVTDEGITLALYDAYRWIMTLSEQHELKRLMAVLQVDVQRQRGLNSKRSFRGWLEGGRRK